MIRQTKHLLLNVYVEAHLVKILQINAYTLLMILKKHPILKLSHL